MKTMLRRKIVTLGVALGLGCGSQAFGDMPIATAKEKTMQGLAARIDPVGKAVWVKGFWGAKRINAADDCKVLIPDKPEAGFADLRPGQKLTIKYEDAQGVLVAHQIAQLNVTFTGVVMAIDPATHTVILRHHALDKTFQFTDDCRVVLRDEKAGTLTDVQPGHRVKVTYEIPNGRPTARQIALMSAAFSGALTALDLTERTLKAKAFSGERKFNLADDYTIVINGKPGGRLRDLKLGDKFLFNYDNVNGVSIVNRIATEEATPARPATASMQSHNFGS